MVFDSVKYQLFGEAKLRVSNVAFRGCSMVLLERSVEAVEVAQ
jgi:hypothetical protein